MRRSKPSVERRRQKLLERHLQSLIRFKTRLRRRWNRPWMLIAPRLRILTGAREVWRNTTTSRAQEKRTNSWSEGILINHQMDTFQLFKSLQCYPNEISTDLIRLWKARNKPRALCNSILGLPLSASKIDQWQPDPQAQEQISQSQNEILSNDQRIQQGPT